jgi:membrane protein YdbS with pleckstrin-like domain
MAVEDTFLKCSNRDCFLFSLIIGALLILLIMGINVYIYKQIVRNAKNRYQLQEQLIKS